MKAVIDIKNDTLRRTVLIVTLPLFPFLVVFFALWSAFEEAWDAIAETPQEFKSVWKGRTR